MEKKVLVIEDDDNIRNNILQLLSFEGFAAIGAADGLKGVETAGTELPDLIICDVSMPELDGYGVLEKIRSTEATRHTPFIFLTARASRQDMRQGMNLGADDYITKPFSDSELLDAVSLRMRKAEQSVAAAQHEHHEAQKKQSSEFSVLVFKENQIVMNVVERTIASASPNLKVHTVSLTRDLIDALDERSFHAAVVDEGSFDYGGMKAVQLIRNNQRHTDIPIVMIVKSDTPQLRQLLSEWRVGWFVARPINLETLRDQLHEAFRSVDRATDSEKKKIPELIYAVIGDTVFFRSVMNLMEHGYRFQVFQSWEAMTRSRESSLPEILFFDCEPATATARSELNLMLNQGVRVVRIADEVATDAAAASAIVTMHKSQSPHETLQTLMRSVLQYTGSFEYNALDFLKDNLLNIFISLVQRQFNLGTGPQPSPATAPLSEAAYQQELLQSTLRYSVESQNLWATFSLQGHYQSMKSLVGESDTVSDNKLSAIVHAWNAALEKVGAQLSKIMQLYGIQWKAEEVTTRVFIDQLPDEFHWYLERPLNLSKSRPLIARFGVTLKEGN